MKQRMSFLDIKAIVKELKFLENRFVQNVYSNNKLFYLKFTSQIIIVIDPGYRIHLTDSVESDGLSHICKKIRLLLRNTKLTKIEQFTDDRIIIIQFNNMRMVLEFFSGGNLIILDENNIILEVFRTFNELNIRKGEKYIFNPVILDYNKDDLPIEKEYFNNYKKFEEENIGFYGEILLKNKKPDIFYSFKNNNNAKEISIEPIKTLKITNEIKNINNLENLNINNLEFNFYDTENLFKNNKIIKFKTFNSCLYHFFHKKKKEVKIKEEKIINAQSNYINLLLKNMEEIQYKIDILNENFSFYEKVLNILKKSKENNLKWEDFENFRIIENNKNNQVSLCIINYCFIKNTVKVKLEDNLFIELNFDISLSKNINKIFNNKKKLKDKMEKTKLFLNKIKIPEKITFQKQNRKNFWFEKFNFFISSENKIIIGGKDATQNETIIKKYFTEKDLFFHCDVIGGSTVIAQNTTLINEKTVKEAAEMALVYSKSWDDNLISSVYSVEYNQVSKSAPSGEYLKKGGFMIKGKKNFLYPFRVEYGITLLFYKDLFSYEYIEDAEFCFPIAAPFSIVSKLKYKVRLVPGNLKKSKLANTIKKIFNDISLGSKEEKLVKSIGNEEYSSIILKNARIGK